MKYSVSIELDENRETCINCPLCKVDDSCSMLNEDDCFEHGDTWDWQLANCPLKEMTELERLAKIGEALENSDAVIARYDKYHQQKPRLLNIDELLEEYRKVE